MLILVCATVGNCIKIHGRDIFYHLCQEKFSCNTCQFNLEATIPHP